MLLFSSGDNRQQQQQQQQQPHFQQLPLLYIKYKIVNYSTSNISLRYIILVYLPFCLFLILL